MGGITLEIAWYLLATGVAGGLIGWLTYGAYSKQRIAKLADDWQIKLDNFIRQRDRLTAETASLRSMVESQQSAMHRHEVAVARGRTDLESARENEKLMSKDLFTLRAEREEIKTKMADFQSRFASVQQQSAELQSEFIKSRDFYKRELTKAFERRKALEVKVENAKAEHESFSNLLHSSRSEHQSVNKMLASARNRLDNLDELEQNVIELKSENAQLRHDASGTRQEIEALQRDVAELDELKVQNKELAQALKSMENSRKQYETDAMRYKDRADQSEQKSETLRLRLDEVEQNFANMEKQQRQALKEARKPMVTQESNGQTPPEPEEDDLKEIVGIGKVFEQTLHELGIVSYRQIANFDVSDVARVNAQLKEFTGRMEQDDWIGQAKDLHFKKYG